MATQSMSVLRSFNRTVTERIGALHDEYLARSRPLGASRVLWEIEDGGTDARSLRERLGLDSGYLSRLLRLLEAEGLVEVAAAESDARVRLIRLTSNGKKEKETLNRLSDELAAAIFAPLNEAQRERLTDAAATVERLMTAGLVEIRIEDPRSEAARFCFEEYFRELDERFDSGFDASLSISADDPELVAPKGLLLVAWLRGHAIGCGALKFHDTHPAEVKRMWVAPDARGLGVGRRILGVLEDKAAERGAAALRLETNRALTAAISLYRSVGFREVKPFNDEPFAHHWFEKSLR